MRYKKCKKHVIFACICKTYLNFFLFFSNYLKKYKHFWNCSRYFSIYADRYLSIKNQEQLMISISFGAGKKFAVFEQNSYFLNNSKHLCHANYFLMLLLLGYVSLDESNKIPVKIFRRGFPDSVSRLINYTSSWKY